MTITTAVLGELYYDSPNSICLICCGSVVQQVIQQNPQEIEQQIETMQFGFRFVVWAGCSAAANHKTDRSNEHITNL